MPTTVVKLKIKDGIVVQGCDVYCGRKQTQGGWGFANSPTLKDSKWMNPFKGDDAAIRFTQYMLEANHPDRLALIEEAKQELTNKVLGCWCVPDKVCHVYFWIWMCDGVCPAPLQTALQTQVVESFLPTQPPSEMSALYNRLAGALAGHFHGDALGACYKRSAGGVSLQNYTDEILHPLKWQAQYVATQTCALGQCTDDTEMTLVLADHLIAHQGQINSEQLVMDYIKWSNSGQPMQGLLTRSLFKDIKTYAGYRNRYQRLLPNASSTEYLETTLNPPPLSNGTVMRCLSLAVLNQGRANEMAKDVWLTNPSTTVYELEDAYLQCLRMALEGRTASQIWAMLVQSPSLAVSKEIQSILNGETRSLKNIKDVAGLYIEGKASCMSALYTAWFCLHTRAYQEVNNLPASDYFDCMHWVIKLHPKSDTDTNAAITGALIGALDGYAHLIKDSTFHRNLTTIMDFSQATEIPRPREYHPVRLFQIAQELEAIWQT